MLHPRRKFCFCFVPTRFSLGKGVDKHLASAVGPSVGNDPRVVANCLLDLADAEGEVTGIPMPVRPLALQKLLYLAHGTHLIRFNSPLIAGHFEAWRYGPVNPVVYQAFKHEVAQPISSRAVARNIMTGQERPLPKLDDPQARWAILNTLRSHGRLSPGRLVDITHAKGGPWATVVNKAKTSVALGLRIPDRVTIERFRFQTVSVGIDALSGEPDDDAPLV